MWPYNDAFPGGTVGIPCGTTPRYLDFEHSIEGLRVPVGTHSFRMPGSNVTLNMETILSQMKGDWLFIMGDDHTFEPDLLYNLLARDVDVIVPLCSRRGPPFLPVLYKDLDIDKGICEAYRWEELNYLSGVIPVAGAGSAGMLIKKRVFEEIPSPVFENLVTPDGKVAGEDVSLSHKINKAGFQIWADMDQVMGHISPVDLRPKRNGNGWEITGIFGQRRTADGLEDMAVKMTWDDK